MVFSYNSIYEKLDDKINRSTIIKPVVTRCLTYSRWWCMIMKFRPLEPPTSYSHNNLGVLRILFPVCESL